MGVRQLFTKKLSAITTTATRRPIGSSDNVPRKITPTSDKVAKRMSAASAARVVTSMRKRTSDSRAGSNVSAASTMKPTATDPAMARPYTKAMPIMYMPRSEIITVIPANSTARPAVSAATTVASSGDIPLLSPSRYRVTMNNA